MASLLFFVLAVLLANVGGHASCVNLPIVANGARTNVECVPCANIPNGCAFPQSCQAIIAGAECEDTYTDVNYFYSGVQKTNNVTVFNSNSSIALTCTNTSPNNCYSNSLAQGYAIVSCRYQWRCDTKCEADSIACITDPSKYWYSASCECGNPPLPPPPPHYWQCQNSGGPEYGGFGGPYVAKLFRCEGAPGGGDVSCENTRDLAGSCQDWGFCNEGQSDCTINTEVHGDPPCGRSGPTFTTAPRCYYACADNSDLSCLPVSTQYVSTATVAGECPSSPPGGCRPSSSSSGAASSGSSSPSSSSSPLSPVPVDTAHFVPQNGEDIEIDYSAVLNAIRDTLHRANVQRDFLLNLDNNISLDLDNISKYSEFGYERLGAVASGVSSVGSAVSAVGSTVSSIHSDVTSTSNNVQIIKNSMAGVSSDVSGINNSLTSFQENGFSLVSSTASDISDSRELLSEINSYLRSDSLYNPRSDTVYNPLLRDIKNSIDSIDVSVSVSGDSSGSLFQRDTAFYKWFARYYSDSVQSTSIVGTALKQFVPSSDSSRVASCDGWRGCMSVYSDMAYCSSAWSVSLSDCVEGGTPLDGIWNTEVSILSKIVDAFWGNDSTDISIIEPGDTNVISSPARDSANSSILGALRSFLSPDSTAALINRVKAMKDTAEKRANDSVEVQPDSLWLDSSEAARYAHNMLLPAGTGNDCFVCHADLGNFGGLAKQSLSIHIDFSNFGGYNFCDIIRAVIKIASFVVCMSLTLGSWAAAFGYNPKNDG